MKYLTYLLIVFALLPFSASAEDPDIGTVLYGGAGGNCVELDAYELSICIPSEWETGYIEIDGSATGDPVCWIVYKDHPDEAEKQCKNFPISEPLTTPTPLPPATGSGVQEDRSIPLLPFVLGGIALLAGGLTLYRKPC